MATSTAGILISDTKLSGVIYTLRVDDDLEELLASSGWKADGEEGDPEVAV